MYNNIMIVDRIPRIIIRVQCALFCFLSDGIMGYDLYILYTRIMRDGNLWETANTNANATSS